MTTAILWPASTLVALIFVTCLGFALDIAAGR